MKRFRKLLACFIAIVMLVGNIPSYAVSYFGTTAKSEYLKTEKRFLTELKKDYGKSELGKLINFTDGIDGTYSSEMDIEIKIPDVKTRKYVIKENGTYNDRYEDGTIEGYVEGKSVATVNIVANDNYISLQVPELYEKYLSIDITKLPNLFEKFGEELDSSTFPKEMVYNSDYKEIFTLSKSEEKILTSAAKKYYKLIEKNFLKNEYFSRNIKQTLTVNNISHKCDTVTYKISINDFVNGLENVWVEFKKDNELVNLLWGKVEALYNLTTRVNGISEELPTKEQVLGAIDTFIDILQDELNGEDELYFSSVLYHQDGKILRRDFSVNEEEPISIYTITSAKEKYYALYFGKNKLEDRVSVKGNETVHNFTITTMARDYDFVDGELVVNEVEQINTMTVKVQKVNNNKYNVKFSVDGSDALVKMEYVNNKNTAKEYDIDLNFNVISEDTVIEINSGLKYKKDIKLNKVDVKKNELNLDETSKEEIIKLFEDNKDDILKKVEGEFGLAFYYDEIMKTRTGMIERMQGRADAATAAQIGKAVRIWYTEYNCDPNMKEAVDNNTGISSLHWTKYSDLYYIDDYINPTLVTNEGYDYYVALKNGGEINSERVVVGVAKSETELPELNSVIEVDTYGYGPRVLYIEP